MIGIEIDRERERSGMHFWMGKLQQSEEMEWNEMK